MPSLLIALVLVGLLSISCQFLAHKLRIPAILPLLLVGIVAGPMMGVINADAVFNDLLFPFVSLAVAIILFEGALTLKMDDIRGHGNMVRLLCTVGALVTMLVVALSAHSLLGVSLELAFLLGAILTVTGPTVIVPMLRAVRPNKKIATVLKWEGIIIDPVGALLAVLMFEFIISSQNAVSNTLIAFAWTVGVGAVTGLMGGYSLGWALRRRVFPHYLTNTAVLTIMLGWFAAANTLAHESGLLTVTIMGIMLANMQNVVVDEVIEFKETLSVLLISGLFILLASRIELHAILSLGWPALVLLLIIVLLARPLCVLSSAWRSGLSWRELALIMWIAPRGIVAAAVSALFALKLEAINYPQADILVPMVFLVIVFTVILQGLTSAKIAGLLGVRRAPARTVLLFGGADFSRQFALELQRHQIPVCIADTNWENIKQARMDGIDTYFGNPMSEHASRHLDLDSIASVLVLSPYKQLNPLVSYHFEDIVGRDAVYVLYNNEHDQRPSHQVSEAYGKRLELFATEATYARLAGHMARGAEIKTTSLSDTFDYEDYHTQYAKHFIPLCCIDSQHDLSFFTASNGLKPAPGSKLMSLILPDTQSSAQNSG